MVFFELCHRPEKLRLSLDRTSIVIFTKFSSLQIMLNYSSSCNSGSCLCPISKNISLQKLGLVSKDVKVILTMNPRPYWFGVHWKNHNVKVTNARIPPEETWQVWYLQSWIWLGQRVSQCSLDLFPRQSCAVWPLSWPPDRVCSPGACSDCPLTCSCVHIGDICKVWNSERWGRHWKPMFWVFF